MIISEEEDNLVLPKCYPVGCTTGLTTKTKPFAAQLQVLTSFLEIKKTMVVAAKLC